MGKIFHILAACAALGGCGSARLFDTYAIPESPDVATAPWPDLVDVPAAPPVGTYTAAVPDPARGVTALADLGAVAGDAAARAAALAPPVLTDADRRALGR